LTISPTGTTPLYALPYLNEIDPPDIATATQQMMLAVESLVNARVGTYGTCAMSTPPVGGVLANGSSKATTGTYAALFAKIGYTYGGAGGNFNLPNFSGRSFVGSGTASGGVTARVLGASSGAETHTLSISELPASPPSGAWSAATTSTDSGHVHGSPAGIQFVIGAYGTPQNNFLGGAIGISNPAAGVSFTTGTASAVAAITSTTTVTTGNLGGGIAAVDNAMQPYTVCTVFIWYA